tara:strand:+ start:99 stop:569 length:471 start_codon:yes stop_codon:yes gene_type:complete
MVKTFELPKHYTIKIDTETGVTVITSNSKHAKGRSLKQRISPYGYLSIKLNEKTYSIHGLVAKYLLGDRPSGLVVNHIDGNKLNNAPSNLEYVSIAENIRHSIKMGFHICCTPKKMPTYKDGRCKDRAAYKKNWYHENRHRILTEAKQKYKDGKSV